MKSDKGLLLFESRYVRTKLNSLDKENYKIMELQLTELSVDGKLKALTTCSGSDQIFPKDSKPKYTKHVSEEYCITITEQICESINDTWDDVKKCEELFSNSFVGMLNSKTYTDKAREHSYTTLRSFVEDKLTIEKNDYPQAQVESKKNIFKTFEENRELYLKVLTSCQNYSKFFDTSNVPPTETVSEKKESSKGI